MLGQNSVHCCPPGSERPPLWPLCNNRCPAFLFPTVSVRLRPVTDAVVRKMGSTDFLFLCMGPVKAGCESNWLLSPTDTGYCPPPTYPPELHDGIGTIVSPQPNNSKSNCVTLDAGNSHCDSSQRPSYLSCRWKIRNIVSARKVGKSVCVCGVCVCVGGLQEFSFNIYKQSVQTANHPTSLFTSNIIWKT